MITDNRTAVSHKSVNKKPKEDKESEQQTGLYLMAGILIEWRME